MQSNFDWMEGAWVYQGDPTQFVQINDNSVAVSFVFEIVNEQQMLSKESNLRVERVIGDVWHLLARDTMSPGLSIGCELIERIYVTELDEFSAPILQLLGGVGDASRRWMWQRRRWLADSTARAQPGAQKSEWDPPGGFHPFWTGVDVQVKARLTGREVLVYHASHLADANVGFFTGDTHIIAPMLRVGVKF